jgi:hypothetical protein
MARVGMDNRVEDAVQRVTELHGILWGQLEGVFVKPVEGVVNNGAWASVMLGDHPEGADAEVWD